MTHGVTGIVLAGGRSTRFGTDKLAVQLDGRSLLDRAIDAVAAVATDVLVVGEAASRANVRHVADPEPFGGPLQALVGGLAATRGELAIVVAGDMPSLVPAVLALLLDDLSASADIDAVVLADPRNPSRRQPVPLAIRAEPARVAAEAALATGDRSLVRLLDRLRVREVVVDRWSLLDPDAATLLDVDVPEDVPRARDATMDQRNR